MVRKKFVILSVFFILLSLTGCTPNFLLDGARMLDNEPTSYIARYRAPFCLELKKQSKGPKANYYLIRKEGKLVLVEFEDSGIGVEIFNHWFGEDGYDHFLTRVKTNMAWHYMISTDRQRGVRIVYRNGKYSLIKKDGLIYIEGKPFAVCELLKMQ